MYKCKQCNLVCETAEEFRKHFIQHLAPHQSNQKNFRIKLSEHSSYVYYCKLCKINLDEKDYKRHSERHGNEVCKICDTCGKVFKLYGSWYTHQQIHIAERSNNKFLCRICGKDFTLTSLLRVHMRVHSKDRPHVCEMCGKRFKTNRHLVRHRITHSDIKPLSCEHCGKGFTCHYNLNAHLRTHTGEKPYKCDVCDAAFTHNVSLKTHKKSVHGIDMWKGIKPPGSQEVDNIDMKNKEWYKLRQFPERCSTGQATTKLHNDFPIPIQSMPNLNLNEKLKSTGSLNNDGHKEPSSEQIIDSSESNSAGIATEKHSQPTTSSASVGETQELEGADIPNLSPDSFVSPARSPAPTEQLVNVLPSSQRSNDSEGQFPLPVRTSESKEHIASVPPSILPSSDSEGQFLHPPVSASNNKDNPIPYKREDILGLSSDYFATGPIRTPDPARMKLTSYMQGSSIPNFPPNHPTLYLPLLGYPELIENQQNIQAPAAVAHSVHAHTSQSNVVLTHSAHGHTSQSNVVLNPAHAHTSQSNAPFDANMSHSQRTGSRWTTEAAGRQFTDL